MNLSTQRAIEEALQLIRSYAPALRVVSVSVAGTTRWYSGPPMLARVRVTFAMVVTSRGRSTRALIVRRGDSWATRRRCSLSRPSSLGHR